MQQTCSSNLRSLQHAKESGTANLGVQQQEHAIVVCFNTKPVKKCSIFTVKTSRKPKFLSTVLVSSKLQKLISNCAEFLLKMCRHRADLRL
ncbi:hypothetical protein A4A49_37137 [Nicotiana attenuata]|uniref:Uncharacterized protein n=1 Tax=Nicotiana attenuata TaxID=49451 RepID=A0A1J6JXX9_NICAT|nr:hypothetical protein A4A49_37137 [Nicotiana attenuata]